MILDDNLRILKTEFSNVLSQVETFDEGPVITNTEETKNGQKTISILKDNKKKYLHSKYNPIREAETVVSSLENITEETSILFYGTGLGYHIDLILKKYPSLNYYIYEPVPEILHSFLSNVNLKKLQIDRFMGISTSLTGKKLDKFIDRNYEKLKVVVLPPHEQIFEDEFQNFQKDFLEIIKNKKRSINTNYSFQKKWIYNSLKNFKQVFSTPNILMEKLGAFKGKTAILVAAGPSLNDEIDNLRYIKEKGLAYIVSVGSSINTLIQHDIYPDVATTYDPTENNQRVFERVKENKINEISLIFGSSVGYETLKNYPGKTYHMITSQDTIASYFLRSKSKENIRIVADAPSIAVVTLQLLYLLGFSQIVLVGQNFAYRGKERYSSGISYGKELTEEEQENGLFVKNVHGNEMLTNATFNSMRNQMERYIASFDNTSVINTTKDGADIRGTIFCELGDFIEKNLKTKIVKRHWLEGDKTNYDTDYLQDKIKKMDSSLNHAKKLNIEFKENLMKIKETTAKLEYKRLEKLYVQLDKILSDIEDNDFYKIFILPMNRIHYKHTVDRIESLNNEKKLPIKAMKIFNTFQNFIDLCDREITNVEEIYEEFKRDVEG